MMLTRMAFGASVRTPFSQRPSRHRPKMSLGATNHCRKREQSSSLKFRRLSFEHEAESVYRRCGRRIGSEELRWSAMTKSDLIEHVAELKKVSKGRAEALVNMIFECLSDALRHDERVEIRGLGSFETRRYGSYKGRNPRTGASVAVKPKRLPYFKVGKELKNLINNLRRTQESPAIQSNEPPSAPDSESRVATSSRK